MEPVRVKRKHKLPDGSTVVEYNLDDVQSQPWYASMVQLIELMKKDSAACWEEIFDNFVGSLRASALYPVAISFQDWDAGYGMDWLEFLRGHFKPHGDRNFATAGKYVEDGVEVDEHHRGSRKLYGHQMRRIHSYSYNDLLGFLLELSVTGGVVPASQWETSVGYGKKLARFCRDYTRFLEVAYLLPPAWYLKGYFAPLSWFELLITAGVLPDDTLRTARGHRCVAKDGHLCNSLAEMEIDNWLFGQGIPHEREPLYPAHPQHNPRGRLRADFSIGNLFIEYAGMLDEERYAKRIEAKKALAESVGLNLAILSPQDLGELDKVLAPLKGIDPKRG